MTVLLAALLTGCDGQARTAPTTGSSDSPGSADSPGSSASADPPSDGSPRPMSQRRLDKLNGFLDEVELVDRVGPEFELRDVDYTSPTDAVASFLDSRFQRVDLGTIIAVTDDNWAHATRIRIGEDLADLVDYLPLGRGAVAIKAQDQFPRRSYPPFVLYPDGEVEPLRVAEPRAPDEDTEVLGMGVHHLLYSMSDEAPALWAADVEAAEIFPIAGSPSGFVRDRLPGREGTLMNVLEYRRGVGGGVWRFETSTDTGRSWRRTDVSLPLGRKNLGWYADVTTHAVGPDRLQAIAMSDAPPDLPLYLWELWWTDDEQAFRRVRLPWDRLRFGGMAFASDGALLLAEVGGSDHWCDQPTCNRPARILRLASGESTPKPLRGAPALFGPFWSVGIEFSGGLIVARTGMRTIAISPDGYSWSRVTPGREDVRQP